MEIFSKVHSQPRLLTRSSWWIPLMLLLACSIAHAFTNHDIDQWMEEYSKKQFDRTRKKYIQKILKKLINYDDLYIKGYKERKTDIAKSVYVHSILKTFTSDEEKIREWTTKYNKKWSAPTDCLNGKLKYFRQIVKENMNYDTIINRWNELSDKSEPTRTAYLRGQFEFLVDGKFGHTQTYEEPNSDGRIINMRVPDWSSEGKFPIVPFEGFDEQTNDHDSSGMPGTTHGHPVQNTHHVIEEKHQTPMESIPNASSSNQPSHGKGRSDALGKLYCFALQKDRHDDEDHSLKYYEATLKAIIEEWQHRSPVIWQILQTFHDTANSFYYTMESRVVLDFFLEKLIKNVDPETPKRCPKLYEIPQRIVELEMKERANCRTLFGTKSLNMLAFDLEGKLGFGITEMHMAKVIELLVIKKLDQQSPDKTVAANTLKTLLYDRFKDVGRGWIRKVNGNPIIQYIMPRKHHKKCEQCGDGVGGFLKNLFSKKSTNCKTCGRLLCKKCSCDGTDGQCCNVGEGCQVYLKDSRPNSAAGPKHILDPANAEGLAKECEAAFNEFCDQPAGTDHSSNYRRLLRGNISDTAFWEGVLTSLVVLLISFFAHYFLFTKPEVSPSRRKTVHIKKKRSTFFKTKNPEKAQTASQVKGAFSSVIRRQLSKLDEN